MNFLILMAIPVIAAAVGWLFGKQTKPPLVDPDEYEFLEPEVM